MTSSSAKESRPSAEGSVSGIGPWGTGAGPQWWGSSSSRTKEAGPATSSKGAVERTVMSAGSKEMVKVGSKAKDAAAAVSSAKGGKKRKNEANAAEPGLPTARASTASMGVVAKVSQTKEYYAI